MKRINSFGDFNSLNEAKLYYLSHFREALNSAPEEFRGIVKDLKDMWGKETGLDMTIFELDGDMLSYTNGRNINPDFNPGEVDISSHETKLLDAYARGRLKIGRFLNSVINKPKKYPESLIDRFVVYLQSHSKGSGWTIKLVKGEEISKYYDSSSYSEGKWGSSLWNSCMTDKKNKLNIKGIFDIYTKNPEVCSLAVMLDSNGKLGARALVWNVSDAACWNNAKQAMDSLGGFRFMDRVYSTGEWMVQKMGRWAAEQGMATRSSNLGHNCETIVYKGNVYDIKMSVDVKKIYYKSFPYLDTFNRYDVKSGKLLNWKPSEFKGFGLQTTSGERTTTGFGPAARNYIRRFSE